MLGFLAPNSIQSKLFIENRICWKKNDIKGEKVTMTIIFQSLGTNSFLFEWFELLLFAGKKVLVVCCVRRCPKRDFYFQFTHSSINCVCVLLLFSPHSSNSIYLWILEILVSCTTFVFRLSQDTVFMLDETYAHAQTHLHCTLAYIFPGITFGYASIYLFVCMFTYSRGSYIAFTVSMN